MNMKYHITLKRRTDELDEAKPNFVPDMKSYTHRGHRPTIWVAVVLLVVSLMGAMVTFGVLFMWRMWRGLGEEVPHQALCPWNRIDKKVTAVTVEAGTDEIPNRLLAADEQTFHCGDTVKDLYYWQHKSLKKIFPKLPKPVIVGLSANNGHMAMTYEKRGAAQCGVQLTTLPNKLDKMIFWPHPAIDTSCFPGIDDETASCMLFDSRGGYRLIGGPGVGVYNIANRSWDKILTQGTGDIISQRVNDMELVGSDILAIGGDKGIDIGRWSSGTWMKICHLDKHSGIAGDDVRIIHQTSAAARLKTADITYLTDERGMGLLRLGLADGTVERVQNLIGEGTAQGLSRESLVRFGEDNVHKALWMLYKDQLAKDKLLAALYQVTGHQMNGLLRTDSWKQSERMTLAVDTYAESPLAWVGGEGLRCVYAASSGAIKAKDAGLNETIVEEIVPTRSAIFVKANNKNKELPTCVYGALREDVNRGGTDWRYCIGPRRFPGLELEDITAVADGTFEGQSALFLGTRSKGIGAFVRTTRELFKAFEAKETGLNEYVPAKGTLDISCDNQRLVQVGLDRSMNFYNGAAWSTVIPASGIPMDPNNITTMVAQGPHLVVGSQQNIGHYNAMTHRWTEIPPIQGLRRLVVAIDRIWAVDDGCALYSCALAEVVNSRRSSGSSSQPPISGNNNTNIWVQEDTFVVDIYGDNHRVVVISKEGQSYKLWMKTPADSEKQIIVETNALPGESQAWTAAAVDGTLLYVAPHSNGIGVYDLSTHKWIVLPLPYGNSSVRSLMATPSGLWLLDGGNSLFFLGKNNKEWVYAAEKVARVNASGDIVMVLTVEGNVLMNDVNAGGVPMKTLIGEGFASSLADVRAGAVFDNHLFVATFSRIGRYSVITHSWQNYDTNTITNITEFASSTNYLYAKSGEGDLLRWNRDNDSWETVKSANGDAMRVRQISGTASSGIIVLDTEGKILCIADNDKEHPVVVLAASRCPVSLPLTVAAESGKDLIIASDDGSIAAYAKPPNGPWSWRHLIRVDGAVRQLLASNTGRIVAVDDNKAVLLKKDATSGEWRMTKTLVDAVGLLRSALSDSDFYGLVEKGTKGASDKLLVKTALPANIGASTDPSSSTTLVIGDRFPVSTRPATAAVCTDDRGMLFRADETGVVAKYSFENHGWTTEPIQQVSQFLRMDEQLWAWCSSNGGLYQYLTDRWQKDEAAWEHVAGDGQSMILTDTDGRVVLRTKKEDRTLIHKLPEELPFKSVNDIAALAECSDLLFLSGRDRPLVSYDRSEHKWRVFTDITGVEHFEKLSGIAEALYAISGSGRLIRYDSVSQNWKPVLPSQQTVKTALGANDRLVVLTVEGDVLLLDAKGQVIASYLPKMLEGREIARLEIAAAAEVKGQLLLLPRHKNRSGELWTYDPQNHSWATHDVEGEPDRFYHSKDGLWFTAQQKNGTITISRIDVLPELKIGVSVDGLLDVSGDGQNNSCCFTRWPHLPVGGGWKTHRH
jgi:hypothetical protein